ncbi:MAG TPA: hypothetical protein VML54_08960, partial [Candidatus Limnocylindrales bacterium]|nr:hypothetical protein [Candidatus Limnocylindrales bacterium]
MPRGPGMLGQEPPGLGARLAGLPALLPFAVFCLHATAFGGWIIDDAGISFAYARNLAAGEGLVAQPGLSPVEGYSNFLWVLLVTPLYFLGLFHTPWTPKILAGALVLLSYVTCYRALAHAAPWGGRVAIAGLVLVSSNTSFVAWTVSGLENPLTVLLVVLLLVCILDAISGNPHPRVALAGGLAATALAMTRPDGVVFTVAYPIALAIAAVSLRRWRLGTVTRALLWYLGGLVPTLMAVAVFRWWYFGDLVPNTYYVKGGPTRQILMQLLWLREPMVEKLLDLVQSVAGGRGRIWALVALLLGGAWLAGRRALGSVHAALALMLLAAT